MLGSLRTLSDQGIDALIFSYNYASWRIQVDIEVRYLTQARFDSLRGPYLCAPQSRAETSV